MTGSGGIRAFEWREPDAVKVACPVLGGRGSSNDLLLPDNSLFIAFNIFRIYKTKEVKVVLKEGEKRDLKAGLNCCLQDVCEPQVSGIQVRKRERFGDEQNLMEGCIFFEDAC